MHSRNSPECRSQQFNDVVLHIFLSDFIHSQRNITDQQKMSLIFNSFLT